MKQDISLISKYFLKNAVENFNIGEIKQIADKLVLRDISYYGDNILHIFFETLTKKIFDITKDKNLDRVKNYLKNDIESDLEIGQYLVDLGVLVNQKNNEDHLPLDMLRGMDGLRRIDEYNRNLKLIYGKIINFAQKIGAVFTTIPACFIQRNIDNEGQFIITENILRFSKIANLIAKKINHARSDRDFKEAPLDAFSVRLIMENLAIKGVFVFCPEIMGNILGEIRKNNLDGSAEISKENRALAIVEIIRQNLNCDDSDNKFIQKRNIVENISSQQLIPQQEMQEMKL